MRKLSQTEQGNLIALLSKALSDEWKAAFQYQIHASRLRGLSRDPIAEHLSEHGEDEVGHAEKLTLHFYSHGLPVDVSVPEIASGSDTVEMINQDLEDEVSAIALYTQIVELCENVPELKDTQMLIESILTDEVEHADDDASFIRSKISEKEGNFGGAERVAVASTLIKAADVVDVLGLEEFADRYTKYAAEI